MEIQIKIKNKIKRKKRAPTRNQKWGILKYLSAKFFTEESKTNQGQRTRVGVWV